MDQHVEQLHKMAADGDVGAMYQAGLLALKQGQVKQAFDWLHKAGEKKHVRAIELLGVLILQGHGVKPDPALAFEYFRSAAMTGDAQALMRCAELMFNGKGVNQDRTGAISCLVESAKQGYPIALRTLGFMMLRQRNIDVDVATSALRLAAYGGDPHSQYYIARHGSTGAEAATWMLHAANSGLYLAQQHKVDVEPVDLGSIKGDLKSQLQRLIPFLDEIKVLDPVDVKSVLLSDKADVSQIEQAFSPAECEYLINASSGMLQPAKVVKADNTIELENIRTGMTASLGQVLDVVVDWLLQRVADLINQPAENAEVPSVIRYMPGEMYKQHGDYLPADSALSDKSRGGQRTHTALVYLNEGFVGGATTFNLLDLKVEPKLGQLLTFTNVTPEDEPLEVSQHTGDKVISGEKWLLSIWFRRYAPGREAM